MPTGWRGVDVPVLEPEEEARAEAGPSLVLLSRLVVCNLVSLDGFYVEGPDWPLEIMDAAFDDDNAERLRSAGTLLAGRITFEGFKGTSGRPSPRIRTRAGRRRTARSPGSTMRWRRWSCRDLDR